MNNISTKSLLPDCIEKLARLIPVVRFTINPLWAKAEWNATTFRWHITDETPPVMGLIFNNAEAGKGLFREMKQTYGHRDEFEEIRIAIIEGSPPGTRSGYSVHICPEPDALAMHATVEGIVLDRKLKHRLSRWNRMYPMPAATPMLPKFKEEFKRHGEFLLAPVTRRDDGKDYFNPELGVIKHTIEFLQLSDISVDDIDAGAINMPARILP